MTVRAEKPQVLDSIILPVPIDMINFDRNTSRHRVLFAPTTESATLTELLDQIPTDIVGNSPYFPAVYFAL